MSKIDRVGPWTVGLCIAMTAMAADARAAETNRATSPKALSEQQVPTNKEELEAVEVARAALARALYVSADTLPVLGIEKRKWPNSGLGCASPDTATLNISRKGYAVMLATPDGIRNVHVAGRQSRICNLQTTATTTEVVTATEAAEAAPPSYDLNAMVERSREDLARRLRVPMKSVRLVSFAAKTWPDNTMDCAIPYEQTKKKTIKGYQIRLRQGERNYVYHTDLVRARACPSIETGTQATITHNYEVSPQPATPASNGPKKKAASIDMKNYYFGVAQRFPSP